MPDRPTDLPIELHELWDHCVAGFALGEDSFHGPEHWRNVYANAMELARDTDGTEVEVVRLFAILHDARRVNEDSDPDHGPRAADLAAELCGTLFDLDDARLAVLCEACVDHDRGKVSDDATIGVCWDADRLDLPRVGIIPMPRLMSTPAGKRRAGEASLRRW
jgi:uncharacterized protein